MPTGGPPFRKLKINLFRRGVWQTYNFNVFAHKLGNQRGIYFFLKLPVWVKIIRNLVVFQPKNPKKKYFFFKNSVTSNLTIFFSRVENFFIFQNVFLLIGTAQKIRTISIVTLTFLTSTYFARFFVFFLKNHIN